MKIRTLLVDANYLVKRSFNGAKDVYTKNGHIGCLYSTITTIRMLIKQHMITKTILFFDGDQGGKMRYLLDHDYKANRKSKDWHNKIELTEAQIKIEKEKDESLLSQVVRIKNYLENLFVRQIEVPEIEADDLIAAYCLEHNNKEEITIFTNDRDFAQLLDLNIKIIFGNIDEPITKENFYFHFNYHYKNVLPIKIICGDTSDNIKGVGGIKLDTLVAHFPEIEYKPITVREICARARTINEDRVKAKKKPLKAFENLLSNLDKLIVNHKLINLREPFLNDEAIEALEQLELPLSPEGRSSNNLYNLMQEDQFLSIYGGTFVNFIESFYTIIMSEKQIFEEYQKNN